MFYSVDKLSTEQAVLVDDDENTFEVSRKILPEQVQEGTILQKQGERYILDIEETEKRRNRIASLLNKLLNKEGE